VVYNLTDLTLKPPDDCLQNIAALHMPNLILIGANHSENLAVMLSTMILQFGKTHRDATFGGASINLPGGGRGPRADTREAFWRDAGDEAGDVAHRRRRKVGAGAQIERCEAVQQVNGATFRDTRGAVSD
jgi:hypothetical protein